MHHVFKFSSIWEVPEFTEPSVGAVVNGWRSNSTVSWHGGFPFSVTSGQDNSLSAVGRDRPISSEDITAQLDSGRSHGD